MPVSLVANRTGTPEGQSRRGHWLAALVLAALVCAVFGPMVRFEFDDFDTNEQVVNNPHIRGLTLENVRHILTSRCITSYYPVRTLTYAVDYQIWGLNAGGFRLTNGLIHLVNVLLVYGLVLRVLRHSVATQTPSTRRANTWVAMCSAALFAIHPVVVEPVAWVPGREELLMTLGALVCFHLHLRARSLDGKANATRQRVACHIGAALCCAAACLSNAMGAVIPLLITAWDLLALTKPRWLRILSGTWPLWLIGVATVLLKGRDAPAESLSNLPEICSREWLMLIVSVCWLNLKTLCWPTKLGILYEWVPARGFRETELILGGLSIGLTVCLLWSIRRHTSLLFGLLWFCLALAPASQLLPHHIARADRFLYLPLVGLCISAATILSALHKTWDRPSAWKAVVAGSGCLLLVLAVISSRQVQTWRNSYTMWENCLRVSPDNPMAHRCFADILARRGEFGKAIPHYYLALRVQPDNIEALNNFALRLAAGDDLELRDYGLAIKLAERGCRLTQGKDPQIRHTLSMALTNLGISQTRRGEFSRAIASFHQALEADPDYDLPLFNLAHLLTSCPDEGLRQPDQAVQLAQRACELTDALDPPRLMILARAYAAAGQREDANAATQQALRLGRTSNDPAAFGNGAHPGETFESRQADETPPNR